MPALRFFAALSVGLAVGVLVMAVTAMAGKASDGDERQHHADELRGGTALSCNDALPAGSSNFMSGLLVTINYLG